MTFDRDLKERRVPALCTWGEELEGKCQGPEGLACCDQGTAGVPERLVPGRRGTSHWKGSWGAGQLRPRKPR